MYLATWHIADWPFSTIRTNNRSFYYNNVKQATWECEVNLKSRSYDASVVIKLSHIFLNVKLFTATLVTRTENERKDGRMSITWSSIPHSLIPTWYCKSENMVVLRNMLNGEHLEPNKKWHQNIPDVYAILILLLWTCFYSFSFFNENGEVDETMMMRSWPIVHVGTVEPRDQARTFRNGEQDRKHRWAFGRGRNDIVRAVWTMCYLYYDNYLGIGIAFAIKNIVTEARVRLLYKKWAEKLHCDTSREKIKMMSNYKTKTDERERHDTFCVPKLATTTLLPILSSSDLPRLTPEALLCLPTQRHCRRLPFLILEKCELNYG